MTSIEYRAALAALGLTQAGAAKLIGKSVRTSNGYANGWPIPRTVSMLLMMLLSDPALRIMPEDISPTDTSSPQ